jgi:hypothetical protein
LKIGRYTHIELPGKRCINALHGLCCSSIIGKNGYCNIHNQNGESLSKRDGTGVWDTETKYVKAMENAPGLLMEVLMHI